MRSLPLLVALVMAGGRADAAELSGGLFQLSGGMAAGGQEVAGAQGLAGMVSESQGGTDAQLVGATKVGISGNLAFTLLDRTIPNTVVAPGSNLMVTVGADAVANDYELFLNMNPLAAPQRVSASSISEANLKANAMPGGPVGPIPQGLVEINLLKDNAQYHDGDMAASSRLLMRYADADNDGLVDATTPPVKAKTLRLFRLDEARRLWERVPGSVVDAASHEVTAQVTHFSVYAVFGTADLQVDSVYAFPVPWSPGKGNPLLGTLADGIRFTNLPTEGTIRIFTLKGELVRTLSIPPGTATLGWDVRTEGGAGVASGVYYWLVEAGSNKRTGKLMVIR